MSNKFFTSDPHFDHKKIIQYANRPFDDVQQMNTALIDNWNKTVGPNDEIYCLGDFAFAPPDRMEQIAAQLNGKKYLILGNHDKKLSYGFKDQFEWVRHYHEVRDVKPNIMLFHYAMRVWNKSHHGSWHLYGHSHGSLPEDPTMKAMDVGVDCHPEYRPFSYEEIKQVMDQRGQQTVDHHR